MNDRFVIHNLHAEYPRDVVAELPTGTWRVTVHDDGTIERSALEAKMFWRGMGYRQVAAWVDVPAEPERSPQANAQVSDVSDALPSEQHMDGAR